MASSALADEPAPIGPRDYRSPRFLIHTDLPPDGAGELLRRLESMTDLLAAYWARPPRGVIEAYVVDDLAHWNANIFPPAALAKIQGGAGICLTVKQSRGEQFVAKSVVYATAAKDVVQHEAVHAYCHQTFGRVGPIWYAEGMAEVGQYWKEGGQNAVNAFPHVIQYLKSSPPRPLGQLIAETKHTGDWQDYCWWWALCHMLGTNPNYAPRFRPLGLAMLTGRNVTFEQVYGPVARQIEFEYLFFIEHMDRGYRAELCAWDWNAKFRPLRASGRPATARVAADRGWQPSGIRVVSDTEYTYTSSGKWQTGPTAEAVDADGAKDDAQQGAGRLMGVLMRDYKLGEPFPLGTEGTFRPEADGDLYLRCRDAWSSLADNTGRVTVKIHARPKTRAAAGEASERPSTGAR